MPELIETDPHAAAVLADNLARHAAALHVVFMRDFAEILSKKERSLRDASRALRAQNQCRIALRLLLKLRAVMDSQKKSRNRTNGLLGEEISHHDQALGKAAPKARLWSTETPPQRVERVAPRPPFRHSEVRRVRRRNVLIRDQAAPHEPGRSCCRPTGPYHSAILGRNDTRRAGNGHDISDSRLQARVPLPESATGWRGNHRHDRMARSHQGDNRARTRCRAQSDPGPGHDLGDHHCRKAVSGRGPGTDSFL